MLCKQCGQQLPDNAYTCTNCGAQIIDECSTRRTNSGLVALSLVLCFLLAFSSLVASFSISLFSYLHSGVLKKAFSNFDATEITLPSLDGRGIPLDEFLDEVTDGRFEEVTGATMEETMELVESDEFQAFLSGPVMEYIDSGLKKGDFSDLFDRESIADFIEQHDDEIYELTGYTFMQLSNGRRTNKLDVDALDEALEELDLETLKTETVKEIVGFNPDSVLSMSSIWLIILSITVVLVLAFVICKTNNWGTLCDYYISISFIASGVVQIALSRIIHGVFHVSAISIFQNLLNPLLTRVLVLGIITLIIGIALAVAAAVVRASWNK